LVIAIRRGIWICAVSNTHYFPQHETVPFVQQQNRLGKKPPPNPLRRKNMAMNKSIFEENWKQIRSKSTARWSLMADFDLLKVDKADDKYNRFVTMLQVKYGFTRQQARDEVNNLWMESELGNRKKA
jgi:hypothetical protein